MVTPQKKNRILVKYSQWRIEAVLSVLQPATSPLAFLQVLLATSCCTEGPPRAVSWTVLKFQVMCDEFDAYVSQMAIGHDHVYIIQFIYIYIYVEI